MVEFVPEIHDKGKEIPVSNDVEDQNDLGIFLILLFDTCVIRLFAEITNISNIILRCLQWIGIRRKLDCKFYS